ncbi:hypothetical protein [Galbibacter orientalis]|uniref:hypothetical protein n=1 Tax=Galbibacter orientalis TaxID=453852 RepID=UPI003080C208
MDFALFKLISPSRLPFYDGEETTTKRVTDFQIRLSGKLGLVGAKFEEQEGSALVPRYLFVLLHKAPVYRNLGELSKIMGDWLFTKKAIEPRKMGGFFTEK